MADLRILVVHPDPDTVVGFNHFLRRARPRWATRAAHTVELMASWLQLEPPDVVITAPRQRQAVMELLAQTGRASDCLVLEHSDWTSSELAVVRHCGLLLRLDLVASPVSLGTRLSRTA